MIALSDPSFFFLAKGGDGFSIFIIIAIIFVVAKLISRFKEKLDDSSNDPSDPPQDMGDLIRRMLKQEKETNPDSYESSVPKVRKQSPPTSDVTIQRPESRTQQPLMPQPVYDIFPREVSITPEETPVSQNIPSAQPSRKKERPAAAEASAPTLTPVLPFAPLKADDIAYNVQRMSQSVEASAQSAIDEAYRSAEKSYQDTLEQMDKIQKAVAAKASMAQSVVVSPGISLNSPEALRNAVLMKEILDTPRGFQ